MAIRESASSHLKLDLHSGTPYWLLKQPSLIRAGPLERSVTCEVAIVGSGITGALLAERLSTHGLDVVIIDRREPGHGSTIASTALLQYDLDVPLHELSERAGATTAARAYWLGVEAIDDWDTACQDLGCRFERRPSLHFSSDFSANQKLRTEFEARRKIGLDVAWVSRDEIRHRWGLETCGGVLSQVGAQMDPCQVTQALLSKCRKAGTRIFACTTVTQSTCDRDLVVLHTKQGPSIGARFVVYASGYEASGLLSDAQVQLSSTFVLASAPVTPRAGQWADRCMLWEYATPYLYARWVDDRLLVGGEDVPFVDETSRDRLIAATTRQLQRRLKRLAPALEVEPQYAWAGTFATTRDGLGFIGPLKNNEPMHVALGFGGNGITMAMIAGKILQEALLGRTHPDQEMFRIDRPRSSAATTAARA